MSNSLGGSVAERRCRLAFKPSYCRQARLSKSTRIFVEPVVLLKKRERPRSSRIRATTVKKSLPRVPKEQPAVRSQVRFGAGAEAQLKALRSGQELVLQVRQSHPC